MVQARSKLTYLLILIVGSLTLCPVIMLALGSFSKGLTAFGSFTLDKYVQAYTDPAFFEVTPAEVPSLIDELPVMAAMAARRGGMRVTGASELRVKESDRLAAVASGLAACGVAVEAGADRLVVHGDGRPPAGGATIASGLDHRIAMSFLVLGLATKKPVAVDDARPIDTSFPGFAELLAGLGADIGPA